MLLDEGRVWMTEQAASRPDAHNVVGQVEVAEVAKVGAARIKAIAFDFDDTLVKLPIEWQHVMADYFVVEIFADTLPAGERAAEVLKVRDQIRAASGTPLTEFMCDLRRRVQDVGITRPAEVGDYRDRFDRLWQRLTARLHRPEHLTPGAGALLELLSQRSIPTFLVTGGDLDHKLAAVRSLGVGRHFPADRVCGDVMAPGSAPFSKAAALQAIDDRVRGDVPPATPVVAFIADGRRDMVAARTAGALGVGFNQAEDADVRVIGEGFPAPAVLRVLCR